MHLTLLLYLQKAFSRVIKFAHFVSVPLDQAHVENKPQNYAHVLYWFFTSIVGS